MNKILVIVIIIFLAVAGVFVFNKQNDSVAPEKITPEEVITVSYTDGTTTVEADFNNDAGTVTFAHDELGMVTLPHAISASGARYANEDESIVFWEHQGEATITKNGEEIFRGPIEQSYE